MRTPFSTVSSTWFSAVALAVIIGGGGCVDRPETPDVETRSWWTFSDAVVGGRIPIFVQERNACRVTAFPITVGVPFPRGSLSDPAYIQIRDGIVSIDPDVNITSRWPDGSIRWASVTFPVNLDPGERRRVQLFFGNRATPDIKPVTSEPDTPADSRIAIHAGRIQLTASTTGDGVTGIYYDMNDDGLFSDAERILGNESGAAIEPRAVLIPIADLHSPDAIRNALASGLKNDATGRPDDFIHYRALTDRTESGVYHAAVGVRGRYTSTLSVRGRHADDLGNVVLPYTIRLKTLGDIPAVIVDYTVALDVDPRQAAPVDLGLNLRMPVTPNALDWKLYYSALKSYPDFRQTGLQLPEPLASDMPAGASPPAVRLVDPRPGNDRPDIAAALPMPGVTAIFPVLRKYQPRFVRSDVSARSVSVSFWNPDEILNSSLLDPLGGCDPAWDKRFELTQAYRMFVAPNASGMPRNPLKKMMWHRARDARGAAFSWRMILMVEPSGTDPASRENLIATLGRPPVVVLPPEWYAMTEVMEPVTTVSAEGKYFRAGTSLDLVFRWLSLHDSRQDMWTGNLDTGAYQTIFRRIPPESSWPRYIPEKNGRIGPPPSRPASEALTQPPDIGARWYHWHGRYGWRSDDNGWTRGLMLRFLTTGKPGVYDRWLAAIEHIVNIATVHPFVAGQANAGLTRGPGTTHFTGSTDNGRYTYPLHWADAYFLTGDDRFSEAVMASADALWTRLRNISRPATAGELRILMAAYELTGEARFGNRIHARLARFNSPRDIRFLPFVPVAHRLALFEGGGKASEKIVDESNEWLKEPPADTMTRREIARIAGLWVAAYQLTGHKKYALACRHILDRLEIFHLADELFDAMQSSDAGSGSFQVSEDFVNDMRIMQQVAPLIELIAVLNRAGLPEPLPGEF